MTTVFHIGGFKASFKVYIAKFLFYYIISDLTKLERRNNNPGLVEIFKIVKQFIPD